MTSRCLIYDDIVAFDKTVAAKKLLWAISDVAGHFYPIMENKKDMVEMKRYIALL